MENLEQEFARIVKEHKDTIYMVCYMFSKDSDDKFVEEYIFV